MALHYYREHNTAVPNNFTQTVGCFNAVKVCLRAKRPIRPELIPVSLAWGDQEYFYSPLDGMPVIAGLPPALSSPTPIYTPGWRGAQWELSVLPKNTTQCPRPGLEPEPLDPEMSALTMRPPCLPQCRSTMLQCSVLCKPALNVQSDSIHLISLALFYANSLELSLFTNHIFTIYVISIMAHWNVSFYHLYFLSHNNVSLVYG